MSRRVRGISRRVELSFPRLVGEAKRSLSAGACVERVDKMEAV